MHGVEALDGAEIGEDKTTKTPLLAKDGLEQKRICGDGNAVNLVISGHGGHGVSLTKGGLEGLQHHGAKLAFADVYGRSIGAAFRRAVAGEVLGLGDNGVIAVKTVALRTTYVGKAKLAGEVWIFAEVFFNTPPARIAGEIEHGPEDHCDAGGACLRCDGSAGLLCDLRVPCGGEIDRGGKYGASIEAVQTFFDKESGDAQTIVRDDPLLDAVGLLRRGIEVMNTADPEIAPEALRLFSKEDGIRRRVCIVGVALDDVAGAGVHVQLPRLLLQRHPPKKIINTAFHGRACLLVERQLLRRLRASIGEMCLSEARCADKHATRETRECGDPASHPSIFTGRAW